MANDIIPFKNIAIASNESFDYYTINRAFTRTYDMITDVSGYVTDVGAPLVGIPYAALDNQGFAQFTNTISGISNNKIIATNEMLSFVNNRALSGTPAGNRTTGAGYLLNDIKYQYGYATLASSPTLSTRTINITFNNINIPAFTQTPRLMYQLYVNASNFNNKILIKDCTNIGATIIIHNNSIISGFLSYGYIIWLAIGV